MNPLVSFFTLSWARRFRRAAPGLLFGLSIGLSACGGEGVEAVDEAEVTSDLTDLRQQAQRLYLRPDLCDGAFAPEDIPVEGSAPIFATLRTMSSTRLFSRLSLPIERLRVTR